MNEIDELFAEEGEDVKEKRLLQHRRWLNPPGKGNAFIAASISREVWQPTKGEKRVDIQADITITDCSRQVTLEFSTWAGTSKSVGERIKKLDIMRDVIDAFRNVLEREQALLLQQEQQKGK
jgi:hypothetical protein